MPIFTVPEHSCEVRYGSNGGIFTVVRALILHPAWPRLGAAILGIPR
eukprot:gene2412-7435_t